MAGRQAGRPAESIFSIAKIVPMYLWLVFPAILFKGCFIGHVILPEVVISLLIPTIKYYCTDLMILLD